MTEKELKAIAAQLSCPTGDSGLEIAEKMNQTNSGMISNTIDQLNLKPNDHVLELGHGNASHLREIFTKTTDLLYTGLEISDSMKDESEKLNKEWVDKKKAEFTLYDGCTLPFSENCFDKIMTVNTLYFWEKPVELLKEIYKVLKIDGMACITFADINFMKTLPFVDTRFELYDVEKFKNLAKEIPFKSIVAVEKNEIVESKAGDTVNRKYLIMKLTK
ncbi:class I SAM-dependent methyltransferase [Aquimarina aquimarini]|uniref:class I SAM-dependent methyltransferase n=1 Tax=Aquimarina aquimarini TaxID=1191734 RepID=UPI000D54BD5C|nr:class I SAM-dependent methyltransferase [Aquimarina aquimarini]